MDLRFLDFIDGAIADFRRAVNRAVCVVVLLERDLDHGTALLSLCSEYRGSPGALEFDPRH